MKAKEDAVSESAEVTTTDVTSTDVSEDTHDTLEAAVDEVSTAQSSTSPTPPPISEPFSAEPAGKRTFFGVGTGGILPALADEIESGTVRSSNTPRPSRDPAEDYSNSDSSKSDFLSEVTRALNAQAMSARASAFEAGRAAPESSALGGSFPRPSGGSPYEMASASANKISSWIEAEFEDPDDGPTSLTPGIISISEDVSGLSNKIPSNGLGPAHGVAQVGQGHAEEAVVLGMPGPSSGSEVTPPPPTLFPPSPPPTLFAPSTPPPAPEIWPSLEVAPHDEATAADLPIPQAAEATRRESAETYPVIAGIPAPVSVPVSVSHRNSSRGSRGEPHLFRSNIKLGTTTLGAMISLTFIGGLGVGYQVGHGRGESTPGALTAAAAIPAAGTPQMAATPPTVQGARATTAAPTAPIAAASRAVAPIADPEGGPSRGGVVTAAAPAGAQDAPRASGERVAVPASKHKTVEPRRSSVSARSSSGVAADTVSVRPTKSTALTAGRASTSSRGAAAGKAGSKNRTRASSGWRDPFAE